MPTKIVDSNVVVQQRARGRGQRREGRAERETVIVLNSADDYAVVDTMHPSFRRACEEVIRRTGRGRERNATNGVRDGRKVRWEFEIPLETMRAATAEARHIKTDLQRAAAAQQLRVARLSRNRCRNDRRGAHDAVSEGCGQDTVPTTANLRRTATGARLSATSASPSPSVKESEQ